MTIKDAEVKINREVFSRPCDFMKEDSKISSKIFDVKVPKLSKESSVVSLGSCFAYHVRNALTDVGVKTNSFVFYDDQITTTIAMKEHFEWVTSDEILSTELICDRVGSKTYGNFANIKSRFLNYKADSRKVVQEADCIILTYGLSEALIDPDTNRSVWHWPGKNNPRSKDLKLHLLTSAENCDNIRKTVKEIRSLNSNAAIVMSLSPVGLSATFRTDYKIVVANTASKCRLRSGLDEFFSSNTDENIFYWPSYEYVMNCNDQWDDDGRHVKDVVVKEIMKEFVTRVGLSENKI